MDAEGDTALDQCLDSIEITFSDISRKLVRKIKTEWNCLMKYKCDVSAKENELFTAKENVMHSNENKVQNEKYLDITLKRLENLKLSNAQLKSKISNLKKEEERVAENCRERAEYMNKKFIICEEKWRRRYESYYPKNPKIQEKERNIKIIEQLRDKLQVLDDEYQKYDKKLFQAKCERNGRNTNESSFYPFNSFVVNVAKIYLDTKNIFGRCEVISKEITFTKNKIKQLKAEREILISSKSSLNPENYENTFVNFEPKATDENNSSEQNSLKCSNYKPKIDKNDVPVQRSESFQNNSANSGRMLSQMDSNACNVDTTSNNLYAKENFANKNEFQPRVSRVRKWLEKLKSVSKFTITSEETEKQEAKGSTAPLKVNEKRTEVTIDLPNDKFSNVLHDNGGILEDAGIAKITNASPLINNKEINTDISNHQETGQARNVDISTNRSVNRNVNVITQSVPSNNTSKYFRKKYSEISMNNWDTSSTYEKIKESRSFNESNIKKRTMLENVMAVEKQIPENEKDVHQNEDKIQETMDIDEKVNNSENCSLNKKHYNQEKTANTSLFEDNFPALSGSNVEVTIAKSLLKNSEVNISSLHLSNNNEGKDSNKIQLDKMEVDEITATKQDVTQNSTEEDITVNNSIVVTQSIHHEALQQRSQTCNLSLSQSPINIGALKENNTKNMQNVDAKTEGCQNTPKDPSIDSSSSVSALVNATASPLTNEQSAKTIASIPQTLSQTSPDPAFTKQMPNSTEYPADAANSDFNSFKPSSVSPGFAYTTRLMYEANASTSGNQPPLLKKDLQNNMLASMSFFSNTLGNNFESVQSPEEDKMDFLASAYEGYLSDSPPAAKGTEKSMFALAENSPRNEGKDDFFPLFGAGNDESNKDNQDDGAQFMFNFSSSKAESPEEDGGGGFKFLF